MKLSRPFLATFVNKIDAKGRVSVPAKFREILEAQGARTLYARASTAGAAIVAGGSDWMALAARHDRRSRPVKRSARRFRLHAARRHGRAQSRRRGTRRFARRSRAPCEPRRCGRVCGSGQLFRDCGNRARSICARFKRAARRRSGADNCAPRTAEARRDERIGASAGVVRGSVGGAQRRVTAMFWSTARSAAAGIRRRCLKRRNALSTASIAIRRPFCVARTLAARYRRAVDAGPRNVWLHERVDVGARRRCARRGCARYRRFVRSDRRGRARVFVSEGRPARHAHGRHRHFGGRRRQHLQRRSAGRHFVRVRRRA